MIYKMKDPNKSALVQVSTETKQVILRDLKIHEDDWKNFRIDVVLIYVGKEPYVFSSVARTDEP
jgi:hypothetical protein